MYLMITFENNCKYLLFLIQFNKISIEITMIVIYICFDKCADITKLKGLIPFKIFVKFYYHYKYCCLYTNYLILNVLLFKNKKKLY